MVAQMVVNQIYLWSPKSMWGVFSFTFNQWKLKLDATLYLSNVKLLGSSICMCRNTKFSYYERIIVNWYDFFQKGIWQQISDRGLKWISYDQRNLIKRIYPKDIKKKKVQKSSVQGLSS